jgi:hypothetical protein
MNEQTPTLPYLQSERHFRKYEKYIQQIVESWPNVIVFTPTPPVASVETLSSRIRITIDSLRNNHWGVDWDFSKFFQICDEIYVSLKTNPGRVTCGPETSVRGLSPIGRKLEFELQAVSSTHQPVPKINLINPSNELILAVVIMHHHRLLVEPSTIQCGDDLRLWETRYDVSITKDGDIYTILS